MTRNTIPEHWPLMRRAYELTLAQGCKSLGVTGACAYRGSSGRRCAVGQVLPDGPDWDALGGTMKFGDLLDMAGIPGPKEDWRRLQCAHDLTDETDFRRDFRSRVAYSLPEFYAWATH